MDTDSSSKFIGSLTKFLQSLCNGYVEFQRGVELVGHIYLNIDTGEKVDYILHERLSKNDENSVTFVSNSFHAQPLDQKKTPDNRDSVSKSGGSNRDNRDSSDDDIMIVDQSGKGIPGSSNSGSIPSRGMKRVGSPSVSERQAQRVRGTGGPSLTPNRGSSSFQQNNRQHSGPSATVTSQNVTQQESLNIGDVKLEQISKDELLSLASQVGEGGSRQPHTAASTAAHSRSPRTGDGAMWIKQEAADDDGGGSETGWSHTRDDSNSNSGSNLYPVMLHQNPAAYSSPVFPGFSGPGAPGSHSADPMPGTSQDPGGLDPSDLHAVYYTPIKSVPLPHFSDQVHEMLLGTNMMGKVPHWVWVKTVQEAAKFYLQMFPNELKDSHIYQRIGRTVFTHYPSIGAPGRRPWSKFIKCLSQKIRHLRYQRQRLREMSQTGNLSMDAVMQNEASLALDQGSTCVIASPPPVVHDQESDTY